MLIHLLLHLSEFFFKVLEEISGLNIEVLINCYFCCKPAIWGLLLAGKVFEEFVALIYLEKFQRISFGTLC